MNKKVKMSVAISLVLLGSFFIFFLTGCSMFRNMVSWLPFLDSAEEGNGIKDKDLTQLVNSIRPYKGNPDSIYRLACYFQERKKHRLALEEFRKVISIDPTYVKAYNGMGVSYDLLGEFPRAAQSYKTALALNPDLDYVQNNLGYSYLLQGDIDSAIDAFQRAITLNNKNRRYHNNLGMAYAKKGQFDLAFAEFKLAGDETKAHHIIAQFYYQNGLYEEAKSHFAKASTMHPANRDTKVGLMATKDLARISQLKDKESSESSPTIISPEGHGQPHEEKDETTPTTEAREAEKKTEEEEANTPVVDRVQENIQSDKEETRYTIQAGAFRNLKYAEIRRDRLIEKGYSAHIKKSGRRKTWHTVEVGNFNTRREAEKEAIKLTSATGLKTCLTTKKAESMILVHNIIRESKEINNPNEDNDIKERDALSHITIEVSNGNGVRLMARRIGNHLRRKGFKEIWLTNANHFNHAKTKIYYRRGYLHDAYRVAREIPGWQNMEKGVKFKEPNTKIKVLIGIDLIRHDEAIFAGYRKS